MLATIIALAAAPITVTAQSPIIARNRVVIARSYPKISLKRGEEGDAVFRMRTNRDGRVDGCRIVKSSGYAALDKATCDIALAGTTAIALQSSEGFKIAGDRDGLIEWRLPDTVARPLVRPEFNVRRNSTGEPIICQRQLVTGSAWREEKLCLTEDDWKRQRQEAQALTYSMQNPQGSRFPQ